MADGRPWRSAVLAVLTVLLAGIAPGLHAAGPGMRLDPDERERLRGELRDQAWHRRDSRSGADGAAGAGGGRHYGPPAAPLFAPGPYGAPPPAGLRDPGRAWAPAADTGWERRGPPAHPARLSPDERRELRRQLRDVNRSGR